MTTQATPQGVPDFREFALRTERLELRPWREADVDAITAACQDPEIQRFVPIPVPYERSHAESFVREVVPAGRAAGTDVVFGAYEAATGEPVASVGLHRIRGLGNPEGGTGEIGYWAMPAARGRGLTTEAVRGVCGWGFGQLGLARIEWLAVVGNEASWQVVRKVGFTREGTLRSYLAHRGARRDMWIGSMLSREWRFA